MRHILFVLFCTYISIIAVIFTTWPHKRSTWGQIRSNFEMDFLKEKCMFIYQFRLRSTAITFIFQNLVKETPKKLIWKMTSCVYSTSGAISQTNIKALVWNLVCLFYIRSYNTYLLVFCKFWKKMVFQKFFWKKIEFLIFGGQKLKILKIRDSHLVENLICIQLALTVCRLLYCLILYDFLNSCHFFIQNGRTWRHQNSIFSKSF